MPARLTLALVLAFAPGLYAQTFRVVSAATFDGSALAPGMIVTAFGSQISGTATAGYTVTVRDSAGVEASAVLFSVADGQISFLIPPAAVLGNATLTLRREGTVLGSSVARIAAVAPGIFTANASGAGAPAGLLLTVAADGSQSTIELFQTAGRGEAASGNRFLPRPFTVIEGQMHLVLFGTGLSGWRSAVTATVGGKPVNVGAALALSAYPGLDQVNVGPLPGLSDRRGEVEVAFTSDGVSSNRVTVAPNMPALGDWGARGQLLEPNSELAVGEVGGKVLVLGGYPASRQTQRTVQAYDPVEDKWELTTPMPIALNHNMAATVSGKLYMIGGQVTDAGAGNFSDRVFEYDPSARTWRERARMPAARGAGVAVVVDGKIYVAGGRPPRGADFAVYDPQADVWRTLPDLPTARNHLAGAAIDGKVYIAGGRFEGGFQSPQSAALEVYDPATNSWSARASMPKPRGGVNGVEAYGCLHVFGGEGNSAAPNGLHPEHDVYNPVTNVWTSLAQMPVPVHGVTGAVFLGGLIYLPGGGTSQGGNSGSLIHQVYRPNMVCR